MDNVHVNISENGFRLLDMSRSIVGPEIGRRSELSACQNDEVAQAPGPEIHHVSAEKPPGIYKYNIIIYIYIISNIIYI